MACIITSCRFLFFEIDTLLNMVYGLSFFSPLSFFSEDLASKPGILLCLTVFFTAFIIANWLMPQAIRFAHRFQLVDHPNFRKKHIKSTPILGGVSIFISVVFALILSSLYLYNYPNVELDFKIVFGLCSAVSLMVFFWIERRYFSGKPLRENIFSNYNSSFCDCKLWRSN